MTMSNGVAVVPSFLVTADVDVGVVGPPVGEPMDHRRVAVVGEDHRPVGGEQSVELGVGQPVWVLGVGTACWHGTFGPASVV
jgi:hypothetical protein